MDVLSFDFLDAPGQDALEEALRQLYCLDALDADGVITDMGRRMAGLPVDPALSRALIEAERLGYVRKRKLYSVIME
jgi:HrpA-like RNA helicase